MKVVPPQTEPSRQPIGRRHDPSPSAYQDYRACLRWEFGFSCAFCLVHEGDLSHNGVEGTGLTSIEHRERREDPPDRARDYVNCFYCCRYCNRDRGVKPRTTPAGGLLNPSSVSWGGRIGIASQAWGIGQAALSASVKYAKDRKAFGKPAKATPMRFGPKKPTH